MDDDKTYKIVRSYYPGYTGKTTRRTIKTGLTLEEAQEHCNDPKTRKDGEWFDGYTEE
jgi:hypothetical protein